MFLLNLQSIPISVRIFEFQQVDHKILPVSVTILILKNLNFFKEKEIKI